MSNTNGPTTTLSPYQQVLAEHENDRDQVFETNIRCLWRANLILAYKASFAVDPTSETPLFPRVNVRGKSIRVLTLSGLLLEAMRALKRESLGRPHNKELSDNEFLRFIEEVLRQELETYEVRLVWWVDHDYWGHRDDGPCPNCKKILAIFPSE